MIRQFLAPILSFGKALKAGALASAEQRRVLQLLRREIVFHHFAQTPRYQESKRLFAQPFKVYSEGNEDGMLHEIFRRIGTESRHFVEIGMGDGLECNTAFLLMQGWSGSWIDCSAEGLEKARRFFGSSPVATTHATITPDNADALVSEAAAGRPLDILSIDIDSFDYCVWEAVTSVRPRVVVVEYNASLPPFVCKTIEYSAEGAPPVGTIYFGASLGALVKLGCRKGYSLVGCSLTGVNAFFVRDDLLGDHFCPPFTAENHYEPPRYGLMVQMGHQPGAGLWRDV